METGKPLISILMAVYEPRMDWLREQLESLEAQIYPNLRLYVRLLCHLKKLRSWSGSASDPFPMKYTGTQRTWVPI